MNTHTDSSTITAWITGRLPADLFDGAPVVTIDREEITIVGPIAPVDLGPEASEADVVAAARGKAREFRERTREARMAVARELEASGSRKVAWGVTVGEHREVFSNLAVPVMTRLRQPERQVLDTLVDAGVARSRAEALAWCVRLVGKHSDEWLGRLRDAMADVERVRQEGP